MGYAPFNLFDFLGKDNIYVLATCRDLVLCCSKENDYNAYYLCNPFTKQWTVLPPPPPTGVRNGVDHLVQIGIMAYDDDDDDRSFDFKILRIIPQMYEDVWKVEIFYSRDISAGWRLIDNVGGWTDTFWSCCEFGGCVPYNGMFVWLIKSGEVEPVVAKLVGFKLNPSNDASLNCTLLPTPPEFKADYISSIIGLFRGRLRLAQWVDIDPFQYDENELANPDLVLRIWQLNSNWELLHEMNFRELEDSTEYSIVRSCLLDGYSTLMSSILAFDPQDGDILYLSFAILKRAPKVEGSFFIFMCNVKQRTLKPIRKLPFTPYPCSSLRLLVPSWPTSVPLLPSV